MTALTVMRDTTAHQWQEVNLQDSAGVDTSVQVEQRRQGKM